MSLAKSAISDTSESEQFFENLKGWKRAQDVADEFGLSIQTIYAWRSKARNRAIVPEGLFIKFNKHLYVRTDVLRRWIASQNSSEL